MHYCLEDVNCSIKRPQDIRYGYIRFAEEAFSCLRAVMLAAFDLLRETGDSSDWVSALVFRAPVSAFFCLGFTIPGNWDPLKHWPAKEKSMVPANAEANLDAVAMASASTTNA